MLDFLALSSSEGINPIVGTVEVSKNEQNTGEGSDEQKSSSGGQKSSLRLSGTAIFKDSKLIGYLNDKETRGVLWVTGRMRQASITAYVPEGLGTVSLYMTSAKRTIKPQISGGKVKINVNVQGVGEVVENDTNLDLGQPQNMKLVDKALTESVQTRIEQTIDKAQHEYKADVFGFGQLIYRKYPRKWGQLKEQWPTMYPGTHRFPLKLK